MIYPCRSRDKVKEFMLLPEIYRYAAEDGNSPNNVSFENTRKRVYLTYSHNGEEVGMVDMHVETGAMCQFHPYILRSHKDHYDTMVQEFFKWFDDNMPEEAVKLNAIIPDFCEGALKAAERAGMTLEGCDRMSYRTALGVHNRLLYGITRDEVRDE